MFSCVDGKRARPAADEKWSRYKWTVYRGVAYDLTDFIQRHPAGAPLPPLVLCCDHAPLGQRIRAPSLAGAVACTAAQVALPEGDYT